MTAARTSGPSLAAYYLTVIRRFIGRIWGSIPHPLGRVGQRLIRLGMGDWNRPDPGEMTTHTRHTTPLFQ